MITLLEMAAIAQEKGLDFEFETNLQYDRYERTASFDSWESQTTLTIFEKDRQIAHNFYHSGWDILNNSDSTQSIQSDYERYNRANGYSCSTFTKRYEAEQRLFNLHQ